MTAFTVYQKSLTLLLAALISGHAIASGSRQRPEPLRYNSAQRLSQVEEPYSLLEWHSDIITPIDTMAADGDYFDYTFDFSEIPEIVSGDFNNLYVRYWSADDNDRDVWIYNFSEEK